jgi:hypothetical protein
MLAMEAGRVRLAVRKLEFACLGSEIVGEDILLFKAGLSHIAMSACVVGDIIVDGDSVGVVDNDATLVRLDNDIVRDDGR